jgi:hypothetical protein
VRLQKTNRWVVSHRWLISIIGVALTASVHPSAAQLLHGQGKKEEPYLNYAYESYRPYENVVFGRDRTPKFDNMGQFVMRGIDVFELQEFRTISPTPGSIISKPVRYQSYLNRLVIGNDSYKGVNTRLIIGDRIRAKFTSLTLDMAVMNGMRMDSHWKGGSLILLASRVDRPIFESFQDKDQRTHGDDNSQTRPRWATYLLGGDLRSQIPGLDVGVSWVNQYRTDSLQKLSDNGMKGTLPATGSPPEWIVVRVLDQDPTDAIGVRVKRPVLTLNGRQLEHTLGPYDRLNPQTLTLTVTRHADRAVIPRVSKDSRGALVIDFPHVSPSPQGHFETQGPGSLVFWFKVPAVLQDNGDSTIVSRAHVDLDVSGDYQVQMSETFNSGFSSNPATYFYTAAESRGTPDNLDDFRRVRVRYGRETGRTLLSGHFDLEVRGFSLRTEYVRNFSFRAYPALVSTELDHIGDQSSAWFVNVRREFGERTKIGGEVFNVDSEYSTTLNVQDDAFTTYTDLLNSPFSFPVTYLEPLLTKGLDRTNTIEFNSVDDNDDKDQFPDSYFIRKTGNVQTGGRFIADPDGVFPGLDADLNGRPDINENLNRIPDYFEPFLLYNVDPDAYAFGPDTNNNGVIDERENDIKPDYPYDRDRRGYHAYAEQLLSKGLTLTLGHHNTWAPAEGGRAKTSYGRLEYRRRIPFLVDLYAVERLKRIEDTIRDDIFGLGRDPIYFQPEVVPLVRLTEDDVLNPLGEAVLIRDPLLSRDSWVNTVYTEARWIQVPRLNVSLNLKHDRNSQQGTSLQPDNVVSDFTIVAKADYEWNPWRKLVVVPQVKWLRQRLQDDDGAIVEIHESFFYPILRLEYPISSRTSIKAGAQGFPVLASTYRNGLVPDVDFDSEVYLVQVGNTSTYLGYEVNVNLGWEKRKRNFKDANRRDQDEEFNRVFLRVIAGLRPLF